MFKDMKCKRMYRSDMNDNVALDFLVPLLENAKLYRRAVGYFSTTSLEMLSVGLAAMERNGGKIEVICSPKLSKEDIEAINLGYKTKEKAFVEALDVSLTNPIDEFAKERLNIVATLVANGVLNFKIAFMEDDNGINIYHEKFGIAYDEAGDRIAFSGSMNDSENGFENNFELITVFSAFMSKRGHLQVQFLNNFLNFFLVYKNISVSQFSPNSAISIVFMHFSYIKNFFF